MNTVIPSLILALSVCLNIYLLFGKWTMAKAHEVNTNIKVTFQFGLWIFTIAYLAINALILPLPFWMFSACLFFFAFVFTLGVNNSIKKHQIKEQ